MRLPVRVSRDEDGMFIAVCPTLPGCVSQGRTERLVTMPGRVKTVLHNLAAGRSAKEISEVFDVTEDAVMAILRFVTSRPAAA